jgi:hypothetical protein
VLCCVALDVPTVDAVGQLRFGRCHAVECSSAQPQACDLAYPSYAVVTVVIFWTTEETIFALGDCLVARLQPQMKDPGRVPRELFPPPALGECLDGVLARRLVTVGRGAILAVAVS